jgi:hypothetical protein
MPIAGIEPRVAIRGMPKRGLSCPLNIDSCIGEAANHSVTEF